MLLLITGLLLFLGIHSIGLLAPSLRQAAITRMGEMPWKGLYSVVSLIGFVLICYGYGQSRLTPVEVWSPPAWINHLTVLLMLPAIILLVASFVPGTSIKARVGHPLVLSVKIWALAHLLNNGRLGDVLLFGAFLAWAAVDFVVLRKRDRVAGITYPRLGIARDVLAVGVGVIAYVGFALWGHRWLIGVGPFGG